MPQQNVYSRQPTKEELLQQNSLVTVLCKDVGYNKEDLDGIELEAKIDLIYKNLFKRNNFEIIIGERLHIPEPYSQDRILDKRASTHHFYGFLNENGKLDYAFSKNSMDNGNKIKLKKNLEYIEYNGIIFTKRLEQHLNNLSPLEINQFISKQAQESKKPLKYVGALLRETKEVFIFNPTSGRIFVITTGICSTELNKNKFYQLELEYYGQVNGFKTSENIYDDMYFLANRLLKDLPNHGYLGKPSRITKFDWLVQQIK